MAGIDYQKAFDRMPHRWIINSLKLIGINDKVISFAKKVMTYWKAHMCLHAKNNLIQTKDKKNKMWNISRRPIITTAILHLLDSSHRKTE